MYVWFVAAPRPQQQPPIFKNFVLFYLVAFAVAGGFSVPVVKKEVYMDYMYYMGGASGPTKKTQKKVVCSADSAYKSLWEH